MEREGVKGESGREGETEGDHGMVEESRCQGRRLIDRDGGRRNGNDVKEQEIGERGRVKGKPIQSRTTLPSHSLKQDGRHFN